jgi:hypothetical protein
MFGPRQRRSTILNLSELINKIPVIIARARVLTGAALAALKKFLSNTRTRKALKIGSLAILGAALLLGLAFFAFRNVILRSILDKQIRSYQENHAGAVLSIGSAKFSGLARIDLENVQVRTAAADFAAVLGKCTIQVSLLKMLTGQVRLKRLALGDLHLDLSSGATPGPARPGCKGAPAQTGPIPGRAPDYGTRAARLLDLYFTRIPDSLEIDRCTIHSAFGDIRQAMYVPRLAIRGPDFATTLEVFDQGKKWACLMAGSINRGEKRLEMRLQPRHDDGPASLPFVERQWGLKVDFTSLAVGLHSRGRKGGVLRLDGSLAIDDLMLNHARIAAEDVKLQNAAIEYFLRIGADFIELDKATKISFNRLAFHPYLKLQSGPPEQLTLRLDKTEFKADDFFSSLPAGLFTRLAGMQTSGELAYHFDFFIDFTRPETLTLEAGLEKLDFRIKRFGRVDFRAVNAPFLYTAYEKDRALRSFMVGPENPDFRSLDRIPPFLKNAVLISEDGAFFAHNGFLLEPFKESIAANLREKRFVRGASTISMQLVKNLYLKRQKTIARKLEEMLITWLIEENRLLTKERMFEIYLNIIEWGPLVYGAQEAARFYFDKDVADLTLAEAIFMASIIPRPKRFMVLFDQAQRLRPWLQAYYADVSAKMLQRGWISQQDFDTLVADIQLKGPARFLLKGQESMPDEPLWQSGEIVE